MTRRMLSTAIAIAIAIATVHANAEPSAQDQAAAETLFVEAKKLMAEGKHAEACPKLDESNRLDPAPGTQFVLGECYEQIGKTASAWALFLNVAAAAKSAGMADREQVARDRAAALEPNLPKLTVVVASPPPNLEVKRDGMVVGPAQWGTAVPVDPGSHAIVAAAPGKKTWEGKVDVGVEGATVTVPPLLDQEATPQKDAPALPEREPDRGLGTQRTLAIVAAGVGVIGVGVGSWFGLRDMSKLDESEAHCRGNLCDAKGVELREEAVAAGDISTIAFTVGLVALGGAAALWFTAPKAKAAALRFSPALGRGNAGMSMGGTF